MKEKLTELILDLRIAKQMPDGEEKTIAVESFFDKVNLLGLKREKGVVCISHDRCYKDHCVHEFSYINNREGINIWILVSIKNDVHSFIAFDADFE